MAKHGVFRVSFILLSNICFRWFIFMLYVSFILSHISCWHWSCGRESFHGKALFHFKYVFTSFRCLAFISFGLFKKYILSSTGKLLLFSLMKRKISSWNIHFNIKIVHQPTMFLLKRLVPDSTCSRFTQTKVGMYLVLLVKYLRRAFLGSYSRFTPNWEEIRKF